MEIRKSPMGVELSIPFITDLGSDHKVVVTYSRFGINPSCPGSLNKAGVKALQQALEVAAVLHEQEYMMGN